MSDAETGSPESRLKEARKQIDIALDDVDDDVARLDLMAATADVEHAIDRLESMENEE